jgi:hypothetical protein
MTVYLVISLPKLQYIHCIYIWLWPTLHTTRVRLARSVQTESA